MLDKYNPLLAFIWTLILAGLGFVLLMILPGKILNIFTNDVNLIQFGIFPIRIIISLMPFIGFQILGGSLFQAIGKTFPSLIIILSRQLLLLLPAIIILPMFFGLTGLWLSIPVSNLVSIIMTAAFLWWQSKKFNEMIKPEILKLYKYRSFIFYNDLSFNNLI